jgi:hypothetical protein
MARPQLLAALGLTILAGSSAGTADECLAVLHAVCGNMTKSVASCLACDGHHQEVLRAALCTNTELTQYCNKAAGSPVQPEVVARLLYDTPPPPHAALRVHAWDPVQKRLFSGGADGQIHQWNVSTQTRLPSLVPPANLSTPITHLLVDGARRKLFSSSTLVHSKSSNITPPWQRPWHRPASLAVSRGGVAPAPPAPPPLLPGAGVYECCTATCGMSCNDRAGANHLNVSHLAVEVISDRSLAINITCTPWYNRTFDGNHHDNANCHHQGTSECRTYPDRCCTGYQVYDSPTAYFCADQRVSWLGSSLQFDKQPGERYSCFQQVVQNCGGEIAPGQDGFGTFVFDRQRNEMAWHIPVYGSRDRDGHIHQLANFTLPLARNISTRDAQSTHVLAEWTYLQAGKVVPELHHVGMLGGHDRSKDPTDSSDDVINAVAFDSVHQRLAMSVSDSVYHLHDPLTPEGGSYQCIKGDAGWDTCGNWSGVEISRINLDFQSLTAADLVRNSTFVNMTRLEIQWQLPGTPGNDTKCVHVNSSFNMVTRELTFPQVALPSPYDCLGNFLKRIMAENFTMHFDASTQTIGIHASVHGEAVVASLRCSYGCKPGQIAGPHLTEVPRDTVLQWVTDKGLGVPMAATEMSCKGINCTSGEDIAGEFAVAMDMDTLRSKLYTINHYRYGTRYSRSCPSPCVSSKFRWQMELRLKTPCVNGGRYNQGTAMDGETWGPESVGCNRTISEYSFATTLPSVRTAVLEGHLGCVVAISVDSVNRCVQGVCPSEQQGCTATELTGRVCLYAYTAGCTAPQSTTPSSNGT